jgi:acylphosphatase
MKWLRFVVYGKVQGVYYRKFVADAMRKAGFKGYVCNLPDGTVEAVVFVYDEEKELPHILEILREGSPMSRTEHIDYETLDSVDHTTEGFEIRY